MKVLTKKNTWKYTPSCIFQQSLLNSYIFNIFQNKYVRYKIMGKFF